MDDLLAAPWREAALVQLRWGKAFSRTIRVRDPGLQEIADVRRIAHGGVQIGVARCREGDLESL